MSAHPLWDISTVAVTTGRDESAGAPFNVPPTFASTYRDGGPVGYGRWGNPTWAAFEQALGRLEGGHAVAFSSGQAGISALLAELPIGARVTVPVDAYLGTRGLLSDLTERGRLRLTYVDVTDTEAVLGALPASDLLWIESPTNPMLGIVDLPVVLHAAKDVGVPAIVDNTFATPLGQQPLRLGASAVLHSATKYLGGHSDLLLGAVVTSDDQHRDRLIERRTFDGAIPGVMEAFLALRGMRTLPVRLARQNATAGILAERLAADQRVHTVHYPGLAVDPGHERACATMSGFGAMLSFELADAQAADRMVGALSLVVGGTSLGGVETTIDRRHRWPGEEHVPPGLLRLSVGLEDADDLWADLDTGLQRA